MMKNHRRLSTSALAALMLVLLAIGVSACGSGEPREVEEGEVITVGKLEYTVIFSRYLNENDAEDVAYLKGQKPVKNDHNYFGVFLQVFNPNHSSFTVVARPDDHRLDRQALQSAAERKRIRLPVRLAS